MFGQVGNLILIADEFTCVCVERALVLFLFVLNLLQNKIIDTFLKQSNGGLLLISRTSNFF